MAAVLKTRSQERASGFGSLKYRRLQSRIAWVFLFLVCLTLQGQPSQPSPFEETFAIPLTNPCRAGGLPAEIRVTLCAEDGKVLRSFVRWVDCSGKAASGDAPDGSRSVSRIPPALDSVRGVAQPPFLLRFDFS